MRTLALLALTPLFAGCNQPSSSAHRAPERTTQIDDLTFALPDGWTTDEATSQFRKAQYTLDAPSGSDPGSLVVYFFGAGGAGTIDDNLDRWRGQFEGATEAVASTTISGIKTHTMNIAGRYVAETRPGSGQHHDKPGTRMLGAIIEAPAGSYFLKALGPDAVIASHQARFQAFLSSMQHQPSGKPTSGAAHP
jgi:hypothetical protein